jgi:hypothetical protein
LETRARAQFGTNRKKFSARERNLLIRDATWMMAWHIVEQKPSARLLTCHMQFATNEELAALHAANAAKKPQPLPPAPEASPFQMDWFREHFPGRCI